MAITASDEHTVHYLIYTYLLFRFILLDLVDVFSPFSSWFTPALLLYSSRYIFFPTPVFGLCLFVAHHPPYACMTFSKWSFLCFCVYAVRTVATVYYFLLYGIPLWHIPKATDFRGYLLIFLQFSHSLFCASIFCLTCVFFFAFLVLYFHICIVRFNCCFCCCKTLKQQPKSNFMAS